jgi:hypothetical protein
MLAEMFMLRLQSLLREGAASEKLPASNARFVPIMPKRD